MNRNEIRVLGSTTAANVAVLVTYNPAKMHFIVLFWPSKTTRFCGVDQRSRGIATMLKLSNNTQLYITHKYSIMAKYNIGTEIRVSCNLNTARAVAHRCSRHSFRLPADFIAAPFLQVCYLFIVD